MKIAIAGSMGRMGQTLVRLVKSSSVCKFIGGTVLEDSTVLEDKNHKDLFTTSNLDEIIPKIDAIIDFTTPQYSLEIAEKCVKYGKNHICGTTGFNDNEMNKLQELAKNTPIFWASNMSVGVNLLIKLTEQVANILDDEYDIEIVEMHHRHKIDSPSGTALSLGKSAANGRKITLNDIACKSRDGVIGQRPKGEIGFATLRGGDVVGDHSVIFAGIGERLELTHKASNRDVFANGAIRAALWSKDKPAGFYNMSDILGI